MTREQRTPEAPHLIGGVGALRNPRVLALRLAHFGAVASNDGIGFRLPQVIQGFGGLTNWRIGFITALPPMWRERSASRCGAVDPTGSTGAGVPGLTAACGGFGADHSDLDFVDFEDFDLVPFPFEGVGSVVARTPEDADEPRSSTSDAGALAGDAAGVDWIGAGEAAVAGPAVGDAAAGDAAAGDAAAGDAAAGDAAAGDAAAGDAAAGDEAAGDEAAGDEAAGDAATAAGDPAEGAPSGGNDASACDTVGVIAAGGAVPGFGCA